MTGEITNGISDAITQGDDQRSSGLAKAALKNGLPLKQIIESLSSGIKRVGELFGSGKYYLPELLLSGNAMKAALKEIEPFIENEKSIFRGKFLIGTVKGDMHDIGKNIVIMMLKGSGWDVFDLGVDVSPEKFCSHVMEGNYHILGMSALLTTTLSSAAETIESLKKAGLREKIKVIVGGAPVTQEYCDRIGADAWGRDAWDAVQKSQVLLDGNR